MTLLFGKTKSTLKQNGIIDVCHDRLISNGTNWDHKIQKELEAADLVVFLLSPDFLNTPYVMTEEIPNAKKLCKEIFFIILKECGWKIITDLSELQMATESLPETATQDRKIPLIVGNPEDEVKWQMAISSLVEKIDEISAKNR